MNVETNHEREGINPSPTNETVGAGFTPARVTGWED